ncbi:hypothetical protein ABGB07_02255 [Micromonosporaceae bacterium B7E4]
MSDDRYLTLADLADELTDSRQHVERIPYWDSNRNRKHHVHRTTMPGLLQQMADLMLPGADPDAGSGKPGSRPPGNWAALADHTAITIEVTRWCWDLRLDIRGTVEGNLRQLVGASMDGDTRARFEKDVRRWHRTAQTVTGWRTPPTEVRAPCPGWDDTRDQECGRRTIRVNLAESEGYCSSCGTSWDAATIGLLGETVRAYNAAAAADATVARARARAERANKDVKVA